jgi:hypothetical protein
VSDPIGYIVVIREHERWAANWDGEIHPTRERCDEEVRLAHAAGFEAMATALAPFPTNTEGDA